MGHLIHAAGSAARYMGPIFHGFLRIHSLCKRGFRFKALMYQFVSLGIPDDEFQIGTVFADGRSDPQTLQLVQNGLI